MVSDKKNQRPLFVDLDGTLVSTDTLWESCLLFIKRYPLHVLRLIIWSFYGKAYFKEQVAKKVIPNAETLPYQDEVVRYVSNVKDSGRDVYLITAANRRVADCISKHLKIFTSAIGSDSKLNLKGKMKLNAIQNTIGTKFFDYIGDSKADIAIWSEAHTAIICGDKHKIKDQLNNNKIVILSGDGKNLIKKWIKALRLHQWSKNGLLFLALFMSHRIIELNLFKQAIIAFFSFSLSASAVYILNDLVDRFLVCTFKPDPVEQVSDLPCSPQARDFFNGTRFTATVPGENLLREFKFLLFTVLRRPLWKFN